MGHDHDNYSLNELLDEKFTSHFRKGYVNYEGFTMPLRYAELKEKIDNFEVYDDDVWICSFPKTGTTWTQEMVWLLANNLDYKRAEANLGERFPFLEVSCLFDYRDLMAKNQQFQPPPFLVDSIDFTAKMKRPRFIKTHLPWKLLPKQIRNGSKKVKILYVARNPKDTCISYYHHCRLLEGYTGSFNEFCALFLSGKLCFSPFWKNVLSYWEKRNLPNVLFLKYEELKQDLTSVVLDVAKFLDVQITAEEVEELKKHLSFESMRSNKAVNYELVVELNRKFELIKEEGCFMRSGTVGNYKAIMPDKVIEDFDQWTESNLENTKLQF